MLETLNMARGSVLVIDECCNLITDERDSVGHEALATIVQYLSEHIGELVVVFWGYTDPVRAMIQHNPGLASRISMEIVFDDYSEQELLAIFQSMAKKQGLWITKEGLALATVFFKRQVLNKGSDFANARLTETLLAKAREQQESRLCTMANHGVNPLSKRALQIITKSDCMAATCAPRALHPRNATDMSRIIGFGAPYHESEREMIG